VQLSGVRYSTIKYYTEEGLLPFEQEDTRMARKYPRVQAIERLEEIRLMKEELSQMYELYKAAHFLAWVSAENRQIFSGRNIYFSCYKTDNFVLISYKKCTNTHVGYAKNNVAHVFLGSLLNIVLRWRKSWTNWHFNNYYMIKYP